MSTPETRWSTLRYNVLLIYLVLVPFDGVVPWATNLVVLMLAALLLPIVLGREPAIELSSSHVAVIGLLVILLALSVIGVVAAERPIVHLVQMRTVLLYLIVVTIFALEVYSVGRIRRMLAVLALTAAGISVLSVLNLYIGVPFGHFIGPVRSWGPIQFFTPRTLGVKMPYGDFGTMVVVGGGFAWLALRKPGRFYPYGTPGVRPVAAGTLALLCVGIVIGQSRANIFAVIGVVGVFAFLRIARSRIGATTLAVIALAGLGALLIVVLNVDALMSAFYSSGPLNAASRVNQYRFAVELIASNPFVGAGLGHFKLLFGQGVQVHNLWLLVGVGLGIPGLIVWTLLVGHLGLRSFQLAMGDQIPFVGAVAFPGFVGFVIEAMFYPGFTDVGAVVIGLLTALVGFRDKAHYPVDRQSEREMTAAGGSSCPA